jgi:hypothetical protein
MATEGEKSANLSMGDAIGMAVRQFSTLAGSQPKAVTGARKLAEGGWSVLVDVVELERIPASTSVIATYRVDLDGDGELASYERLRRFNVGATDSS